MVYRMLWAMVGRYRRWADVDDGGQWAINDWTPSNAAARIVWAAVLDGNHDGGNDGGNDGGRTMMFELDS